MTTATASTSTITASETAVGMWYHRLMIILMPTNARITASPCCKYSNRECMSASMKYRETTPMIANAFDVNTMNCSLLTASTAGTESTANKTSVDSTSNSTANSGVAKRLPSVRTNMLWPCNSEVVGTNRCTTFRNRLCEGSTASS